MKKILLTIFVLITICLAGVYIYFQYPSVLPFNKPVVLDFKACNNNAYCTAQKLTQIKTFADYDSYLQQHNSFADLFFGGITKIFLNFLPVDRINIDQSYCDALKFGDSKESCNFALKVRSSEVDCSAQIQNKAYEYSEFNVTEYIDTNQICIKEKVLAGQITDCSEYVDEAHSTCQLALLAYSKDEQQCSAILKDVTDSPEMICAILLKLKQTQSFSVADCKNNIDCYKLIDLIRTYFIIKDDFESCTTLGVDEKEKCEETNKNLRAFNTNAISSCTNDVCIKDTISKMIYKKEITTKDVVVCNTFNDPDLKSVCLEALYTEYAFYNLDPLNCPDSLCLTALKENILAIDSYCTNLLFPMDSKDSKDELINDCNKVVLPKLAAKNEDATICNYYSCFDEMYKELIKQKNYSLKICTTIEDTYKAEDCRSKLNTANAIANNNPIICVDDSNCISKYAKSSYKNTLPCSAIINNDTKFVCEDEVQFNLKKETITLADCKNYHSPSFCLKAYFNMTDAETIASLDHTICTTFNVEDQAICLEAISQAAGVYSGCNKNESCIDTVYRNTQSSDCSNAGKWLPESAQKTAQDFCNTVIKKQEALLYKKIANCSDELCIKSILDDIDELKFPIEFIRKIALPTELLAIMFYDPFDDALDLEQQFDGTLIISKKDLMLTPEYIHSSTEVKTVVDDIYNQLDLNIQLKNCGQINSSIILTFKIPIQVQCKQLVSTKLAYTLNNGNLCGTEDCFEDFIDENPNSINCNSLNKEFTDTFNHESLQQSCNAYKSLLVK